MNLGYDNFRYDPVQADGAQVFQVSTHKHY